MASVDIGPNTYSSFIDNDYADEYLAADVSRATTWAALAADDKGRAIVTATRLLLRQSWRDGPPSLDTPPDEVQQSTALLAADVIAKPSLGDSGSTSSNVKAVGAGSARVEFFSPIAGTSLPPAAFALLRALLGPPGGTGSDSSVFDGSAYGSSNCQVSRFDPTDYELLRYPAQVDDWRY